jgi:hypothetical protein
VPCQNPPFGEMIAVDLATGDVRWRSVLGRIEALEALGVRDTGSLNMGGSIATGGGVVFIGATNDSRFRAFDSKTGQLLWETKIDASAHTSPITYLGRDGRQYVAVMAAGGGGYLGGGSSDALVGFALPDVPRKPLPAVVTKMAATTAKQAPLVLPAGGLQVLAERTCGSGCHAMEVVTSQRMSKAEWRAVIQNMVARGAKASDAEVDALAGYFAKTLGK